MIKVTLAQENRKPEALLVNYTGRFGGGPIFGLEMTKGLIGNGIKVVAVISRNVENLDEWKRLGLEQLIVIPTYKSLASFLLNSALFKFRQANVIKRRTKDLNITYIYIPMICPWSDKVNKLFRHAKVCTTIHDPMPHSGEKLRSRFLSGKIERRSDKLITLTKKFVPYLEDRYKKPVAHIPHGRFSYYKERHFTNFEDNGKINFLFFGRLEAYKGLHVLADAFGLCCDKMDNYTLTVAGAGDFSQYREAFSKIPNFTLINKWLSSEEVNELFKYKNTVLILPYTDATQSGVISIAMEYNTTIIASDTGGLGEQIDHDKTGILFEPGNAQALATQILSVYRNAELRTRLATTALESLEALNWDRLAESLIKFINSAC